MPIFSKATLLGVGQGCSTLIEVWNGINYADHDSNTFVALVDCGSDDRRVTNEMTGDKEQAHNVINTICTIKEAMEKRRKTLEGTNYPFLDILMITHQDRDHWNKLRLLFGEISRSRIETIEEESMEIYIPVDSFINFNLFPVQVKGIFQEETYYLMDEEGILLYSAYQEIEYNDIFYYTTLGNLFIPQSSGVFNNNQEIIVDIKIGDLVYYTVGFNYNTTQHTLEWYIESDDIMFEFECWQENGTYIIWCEGNAIDKCDVTSQGDNLVKYIIDESIKWINSKFKMHINNNYVSDIMLIYSNFMKTLKVSELEKRIHESADIEKCIGRAYIGGDVGEETPSFKKMKKEIEALSINGIKQLTGESGRLSPLDYSTNLLSIVCCENFDTLGFPKGRSPSMKKNASGAVIYWDGAQKLLLPGDATVHTMFYMINHSLLDHKKGCLLLAPHHGSGTSSKGSYPDDKCEWSILGKFMEELAPGYVVVSAGYNNHHGHPNISFMCKSTAVLAGNFPHYVYYNDKEEGSKNKRYMIRREEKLYYTTIIDDPHKGRNLCYSHLEYPLWEDQTLTKPLVVHALNELENIETPITTQVIRQKKDSIDMDKIDFLPYQLGGLVK